MCGIIGICGFAGAGPDLEDRVANARDRMLSRGPDAAGLVRIDHATGLTTVLGHRRLSIQDLSDAGAQPMRSRSGRYTIVYNGEVYNTAELRRDLIGLGVLLKSKCDTELVLEGFAAWGPAVLDRLRGIFAFSVVDRESGEVFLARDRLGVKPLYVGFGPWGLAFASDARALRELGPGRDLDRESVALYLMLGYVPAPRSIWTGIEKLEPGQFMHWQPRGVQRRQFYWQAPDATDFEESPDTLADLVDAVVEEQLLSDVPVGMFLSAGLDSSVIASSLARLGAGAANVRALSVSFPDNPARDEAGVAEETAAYLRLEIERLELRGDPSELRREAMGTLDEPLAYSAVATQAAVSRLASEAGMKVVLSGDGGDEVFGGYRWYGPGLPTSVKAPGFLDLRGQLKARDRRMGDAYREQSWHIAHAQRVFPALRADQASRLVGGLGAKACAELATEALRRHDAPDLPEKRRAQRIDLMTFCADVVLPKVDRAGMAYGVEARPPLLDHRIVEWGLSRPVTEAHDARPKQALRDLLAARGLSHVLDLPKRGFSLKTAHRYDRRLLGHQADIATRGAGFDRNWRRVLFSTGEAYGNKLDTLALFGEWMEQQEPFGGMA